MYLKFIFQMTSALKQKIGPERAKWEVMRNMIRLVDYAWTQADEIVDNRPKNREKRWFNGSHVALLMNMDDLDNENCKVCMGLIMWSLVLKLILNHQESLCTEKLYIVKFRAPFDEAGLHKTGQTAENCLQNV
jgi:hypothetical protein